MAQRPPTRPVPPSGRVFKLMELLLSSGIVPDSRKRLFMTVHGHCLCKAITFELTGPHNWVGHCYCDSCRRGAGAPVVTFVGHPNGHWRWTGAKPQTYTSSPGNYRQFCPVCGSSVTFLSDRYPDEVHFHAALLEHPELLSPSGVFHADERLIWHLDPAP